MESSSTLFSEDHFPCVFSEIFKTLFSPGALGLTKEKIRIKLIFIP